MSVLSAEYMCIHRTVGEENSLTLEHTVKIDVMSDPQVILL